MLAGSPVVPLGPRRSECKSSFSLGLLRTKYDQLLKAAAFPRECCQFPGPLCSSFADRLSGEIEFINDLSLVGWRLAPGE